MFQAWLNNMYVSGHLNLNRKLQDVRDRLKQLRDLIGHYQVIKEMFLACFSFVSLFLRACLFNFFVLFNSLKFVLFHDN